MSSRALVAPTLSMDLSGGHQTAFPWAEYQPALEIPQDAKLEPINTPSHPPAPSLNR